MNSRLFLLMILVSFLVTNCKDTPIVSKLPKKNNDTLTTQAPKKFSKADLARIYGVRITRAGDTLLPPIPKDSIQEFLKQYGKENTETRVRMKTSYGTIEIELFNETPIERASFIFLIKNNYFSHSVTHRVVQNFVVQAGNSDNRITAMKRTSAGNYRLAPHYVSKFKHVRGTVSLAKEWENNPEDLHDPFEFFITLGSSPHLDGKHTIFGRVTSGMDVADAISKVKTDEGDWPLKDIYIEMSVIDK